MWDGIKSLFNVEVDHVHVIFSRYSIVNQVREYNELLYSRSVLHEAELVIRDVEGDVLIDLVKNDAFQNFENAT